jgi:hypothetical protein
MVVEAFLSRIDAILCVGHRRDYARAFICHHGLLPSHQQACFESESSAISRGASAHEAIAMFIAEVRA